MDGQDRGATSSQPSNSPPDRSGEEPRKSTSDSFPTLRFPRPSGSQTLAHWVSHSSADIMSVAGSHDEASLGDSVYEIINSTDGEESQDGRVTESESAFSLDYARTDDVYSIDGAEQSHEEDVPSEDEAEGNPQMNPSRASSIQYTEHVLGSPSAHAAGLRVSEDRVATPLNQSIEFEETEGEYLDGISVKHTLRSFNEAENVAIAAKMKLHEPPPKSSVVTIRLTMSKKCLSSSEPLRVLYVGSAAARREIIYKISTALYASASSDRAGSLKRQSTDGIYNIVPISDGGSAAVPEVELMSTSAFQIKVEDCISAEAKEGDVFSDGPVYSITIRNENDVDKTYRSSYTPTGSVVDPKWSLPHVAIFYVAESDTDLMKATRNAAWEFMTRHAVPSIFISNAETFSKPDDGRWRDFIHQHSIHLCLEARDAMPKPFRLERLPIDLASFLKIDARQMNRNLAFLTGLQDTAEDTFVDEVDNGTGKTEASVLTITEPETRDEPKVQATAAKPRSTREVVGKVKHATMEQKAFLLRIFIALLGIAVGIIVGNYSAANSRAPPEPIVQTSTVVSTSTVSSFSTITSSSVATSTVIISLTKTVKVTPTKETATALSIPPSKDLTATAPLLFGGLRSDKVQEVPSDQDPICSTERYSSNEILLKIPLSTKTSWLAKDSIFIDVTRDDVVIKTKFSSIDEGILIEIPKREAYGILNISVTTTRKPKVNETFEVNFGKPILADALDKGMEYMKLLGSRASGLFNEARDLADRYSGAGESASRSFQEHIEAIQKEASRLAREAWKVADDYADRAAEWRPRMASAHVDKMLRELREQTKARTRKVEDVRDRARIAVVKAQINSYLWFLRLQAREAEYKAYAKKAVPFLEEKIRAAEKAKQQRQGDWDEGSLWARARRHRERKAWRRHAKAGKYQA